MTSKLTREELLNIIETDHVQCGEASALARIALAAMGSEPVAWDYEWASYITCEGPQDFKRIIEREAPPAWAIEEGQARNIIPLYRHAQQPVVPDYPETLPCPVLLEPGMRFGKGVKTRLVLDAIQRRAEHYAELEAMTPEERAEHDANIETFKAMLAAVPPAPKQENI